MLGVVALALASAVAPAVRGEPTDADFVAARDAFRAGDAARLERIAPRLNGYLLEAYVEYWRLKLKLDDADPVAVRAFLERYANVPLAERLLAEWLKSLAKRGEWKTFGDFYLKQPSEDVELACYTAQWRWQQEGGEALDDVRGFWFSGQDQPESCRPVFAALIAK